MMKYHFLFHNIIKSQWKRGRKSELKFWDEYFKTKGLQWPQVFQSAQDPTLPLQSHLQQLLPQNDRVHILDVGSGPLTLLGKTCKEKKITITAIDPLAEEYSKILLKYEITPLVRTENLEAEKLSTRFKPMTFDLAYARNSLDHSYNPEKAIEQMIFVLKNSCYIVLEHHLNEAKKRNYKGMHQWNFLINEEGEFLIRSKKVEVNITQKYAGIHTILSNYYKEKNLLRIIIQKNLHCGETI